MSFLRFFLFRFSFSRNVRDSYLSFSDMFSMVTLAFQMCPCPDSSLSELSVFRSFLLTLLQMFVLGCVVCSNPLFRPIMSEEFPSSALSYPDIPFLTTSPTNLDCPCFTCVLVSRYSFFKMFVSRFIV